MPTSYPSPGDCSFPLVREAWQRGLDVLQPSSAQLERGLALHRDALVFDTFAFLPVGWNEPSVARINALAEAGVCGNEYNFQLGETKLLAPTRDEASRALFREIMRCTGINGMFHSAMEGKYRTEDIKHAAASIHVCSTFPETIRRYHQAEDLAKAQEDDRIVVAFSSNGPPMAGNLNDPREELGWFETWYHLGIRMMHLSYNRRNLVATGCAERHDAGLSELGYEVVAEMNRVGIVVDLAHSSELSALHAAEASTKPIVVSHACCRALFDHMRNKSDEVLRAIAGTGGLIGVTSRPAFLGGDGSIATLLDHIDHAVRVVGADHVAVGTDTTFIPPYPPNWVRPHKTAWTPRWWGSWESQRTHAKTGSDDHRTGTLAWTNWPLITVGLLMRGHSEEAIRKILGLNMLRVLRDNQPCL